MTGSDREVKRSFPDTMSRSWCPPWCVTHHAVAHGEDDWVHVGEPLVLSAGVFALLCMSVEPESGAVNGPYVVIGSSEFSLKEAESLGASLTALARLGGCVTPPEAGGMRSHDRRR